MNVTLKILETLVGKGELTLEELVKLLPKKTNDHRDLYPLASLISLGYIEDHNTKIYLGYLQIQS